MSVAATPLRVALLRAARGSLAQPVVRPLGPTFARRRTHALGFRPAVLAVAKSAFGLYALFRAAGEGRTVIYSASRGGHAVFKGGKAYKARVADLLLLNDLGDRTALYISDCLPPVAPSGC